MVVSPPGGGGLCLLSWMASVLAGLASRIARVTIALPNGLIFQHLLYECLIAFFLGGLPPEKFSNRIGQAG
jgi:hypothetical protein